MTEVKEKKGQVIPRVSRDITPFDDMDRMFNRLFGTRMLRPFDWTLPDWARLHEFEEQIPAVDVIDRDDEVLVRAQLPGLEKDQVEVTVADDYLTIRGEKREEKEEKGEFYRSEIRYGSFSRTVHLPGTVDGEKAKAKYDAGLLEIRLPKVEKVKKRHVKID